MLGTLNTKGGWADTYDKEWDTLTNCMAMAAEEERIKQVRVAKLESDLETLKLEVSKNLVGSPLTDPGALSLIHI